ncbi:sodium:solute symporter [Parvicella tangerina]|uniref:Sodium/glucose cotransporter n=1 Tax=Parvicella tangerina TaxID=2829795 RepID=A0A916JPG4_9FLAO|nr:sodium:solute symporter [Parvicella tangerina]CAG5084624.1 Sodium/glucose cotransporter [Parvicella tangerina]
MDILLGSVNIEVSLLCLFAYMSAITVLTIIIIYFMVLMGIMYLTSKGATNETFFVGERKSPWHIVAYGMIGASLSGVTFISVPGWVEGSQFSYMQMVLGYLVGYFVIAYVLLPIYYKLNLTSIYTYLEQRFGVISHKTGAIIFLGSRVLGASVRILLVASVLDAFVLSQWNVPFEVTVIASIALIWVYTNRGGIKTIIWTDTLQTTFMIIAVIVACIVVADQLDLFSKGVFSSIVNSEYSQIFFFEDINAKSHFLKYFLGGMFITIGMTGLDQDMMQKNLTCKSLKDAQKNMIFFSVILVFVNLLFLGMGALLYMYSNSTGIGQGVDSADHLFPSIALASETGNILAILFIIGLIAAAYSSADSALTSLTTSISFDLLNIEKKEKKQQNTLRKRVHVGVSLLLILVVLILKKYTDKSAIDALMFFAGFTYGPLIGIFAFGILTKRHISDLLVPILSIISIGISVLLSLYSKGGKLVDEGAPGILGDYVLGHELIIINAFITFILLIGFSKKAKLVV